MGDPAAAISVFGLESGAALAAVRGVPVEDPGVVFKYGKGCIIDRYQHSAYF